MDDDFVGRMTPQGWLLIQHLNRCSAIVTNPNTDAVGLDAEVMWTWALIRSKVKGTKAYTDPEAGWEATIAKLGQIQAQSRMPTPAELARGKVPMSPAEATALRLQVRIDQFECLISSAVEAHMLDVASLPVDDQRR